jgi:hypothetical protein
MWIGKGKGGEGMVPRNQQYQSAFLSSPRTKSSLYRGTGTQIPDLTNLVQHQNVLLLQFPVE